jgi:hypothetical protein
MADKANASDTLADDYGIPGVTLPKNVFPSTKHHAMHFGTNNSMTIPIVYFYSPFLMTFNTVYRIYNMFSHLFFTSFL